MSDEHHTHEWQSFCAMCEYEKAKAENERLQAVVDGLSADCKRLEDDREYNADLCRKQQAVVDAARLTVEFGYPKCFTVEQVDRLIALEKAVHALPGDARLPVLCREIRR